MTTLASDSGYSEETCVRCGWTMGDPPLNCQNDDTPHRFPSQGSLVAKITHGRHCICSACARQDWSETGLAPCGMHGPSCPPVYAPLGAPGEPDPTPRNAPPRDRFPHTPDHRIRSVVTFTLPSSGERWHWPIARNDRAAIDALCEVLDRAGAPWKVTA